VDKTDISYTCGSPHKDIPNTIASNEILNHISLMRNTV